MVSNDTMIKTKRPSKKEILNKIKQAKEIIKKGDIFILNKGNVFEDDAQELGYDISTELKILLLDLLESTEAKNYVGSHPPQRAYEQKIYKQELWAFKVKTDYFETDKEIEVYYKFAIKSNTLFIVSLHKDRGDRNYEKNT